MTLRVSAILKKRLFVVKNKEIMFLFEYPKVAYYDTVIGYNELSKTLNRPVASVRNSICAIKRYNKGHKKNKKEMIVRDNSGKKYLLIMESMLNEGK